MAIDPISLAAGIGAGEQAEQIRSDGKLSEIRAAHHNETADILESTLAVMKVAEQFKQNAIVLQKNAVIHENTIKELQGQNQALAAKVNHLETEISKRWIPYGVTLKASLVARKIQRETLVEELKKANPGYADKIIQDAEDQTGIEYRSQRKGDKLVALIEDVEKESQDGRLS